MAQLKLLFLDTFSHDDNEAMDGVNLDLIQFNEVVVVKELRIIPLGAKVKFNPVGARLGATNPSLFHVEAYVNNRNTKNPATFQKIGSMDFHERNIQMVIDGQCPTDCLIIKGYYSAVTLAVYGHDMKEMSNLQQPIINLQKSQQIKTVNPPEVINKDPVVPAVVKKEPSGIHVSVKSLIQNPSSPTKILPTEQVTATSSISPMQVDLMPVVKPAVSESADSINSQLYGVISATEEGSGNGDGGGGGGTVGGGGMESDDLEMYSEEDVLAGDIITTDETGYDDGYECYAEINSFNPYQFEVTPLATYFNPALSEYEQEKLKLSDTEILTVPAERLVELVETFRAHPHNDKWVQAMEEIGDILAPALASLSLVDPACFDATINTLVEWTLESLTIQAAMRQPETPYKVRHLKMGIKFAGQILLLYENLTTRLLEMGVLQLLFDLFNSPYMATSLLLLIIKSLDLLTQTPCGIRWFIRDVGSANYKSGYQQLLDIVLVKRSARVVVAVSALLQKLHVYETLKKLQDCADKLAEKSFRFMCVADRMANTRQGETMESAPPESTTAGDEQMDPVDGSEVDMIVLCLEEACTSLKHAKSLIAQPAQRHLPSRKLFQISGPVSNPFPSLFSMFTTCKLLEVLFVFLASPLLSTEPDIFGAACAFLKELLKSQSGLLYMSTNVDAMNCIIRTLLQSAFDKDSEAEENSSQTLGLIIVYQLQALQYMDQLKDNISQSDSDDYVTSVDDPELLGILHAMLGLTIIPQGRDALINVLSQDLEPLLFLITPSGEEEMDGKLRSSVTAKYMNSFIDLVLMYTTDVSILLPQIPRLISLINFDESSKIFGSVLDWLEPYQDLGKLDYSCAGALAKLFHSHVDQLPKIEVGLVSCLRIMMSIALAPERVTTAEGYTPEELCYQAALLELYREDCLGGWIKIIDKLSEKQLHSWQRGATMPAADRDLLIFIIQPALTLMKSINAQVIEARGVKYQDTSALEPLFKTFTVICSVPVGSMDCDVTDQIQRTIIDVLAQYTQPQISGTEAEINDAMTNSLWTSMVKALLTFTTSHPCNYLSGTLMFSELLPIPLPIQCIQPLPEDDVKLNIDYRTIWSAHLLPIASELTFYIENIAGSSCLHLQSAFRRICWQLSDLNHHFAQFVTRSLLKAFIDNLPPPVPPPQTDPTPGGEMTAAVEDKQMALVYVADTVATNTIGILSYLVQQAPARTALLNALRIKEEVSCNYTEMFDKLLITLNTVSESASHNQCQENIVSLLQSLCDIELSLIDDLDSVDIMTQLANELPDPETHEKITLTFMDHIGNYDHCYVSILQSLRTLVMFTEYNYTFTCLTRALLKDSRSLYNLFTRINNTFSKDSSDCISTLSTALQLLRLLVELDDNPNAQRSQTVTPKELALMVNWKVQPHPLDDLEKLLVDLVEASLEGIVTNITSINKLLKSVETNDSAESSGEPETMDTTEDSLVKLPEPASMQEQFAKRSVFVVCNVDVDKHSSAYWLTNLEADDSNVEETDDRVQSDLIQLCEQYIKDFSLEDELKKTETGHDNLANVTIIHSRKNEVLAMGQAGTEFKAPMRGLGVMRRGQQRGRISNRGGRDHFRDRAQNTSRPPSMHVDDFVKISHTPPVGEPQQMNFPQRDRGGRGGFDGGRGRNRFQTAPDGFKPNFRGCFRGNNRGGARGSPNPRGGYFYNRFDGENPRFAGGRGGMMNDGGGMRPDRRHFPSPQNSGRYGNNDSPMSDRRQYTPRSGMSDGRGGMGRGRGGSMYYNNRDKDSRMGQAMGRDRDRPNHYRSYTK